MMEPFYEDDLVTIFHGDCRDVLPTIDPDDVDLLLTDPPYGMDAAVDWGSRVGDASGRERPGSLRKYQSRQEWTPVEGDDEPFDPRPLLRFGRCVLFGGNWFADKLPPSGCWIAWDKRKDSAPNPMMAEMELAWTNFPLQRVQVFRNKWYGKARLAEEPEVLHPTQKPASLMRWIVDRWTEPGDLVLDPYMGSGPVAQACHDLGRRYIGVELVEDYCRAAVDRLAQQVLPLGGVS